MTANPPTSVFPGLLGNNSGLYPTRPENFLASFLAHVRAIALTFWLATRKSTLHVRRSASRK